MKAIVTVDEVGRLVLPKNIRRAIGVFGRTSLNVEVVDNAARITPPVPETRQVVRKRGRLVYSESLPEDWDRGEAVSGGSASHQLFYLPCFDRYIRH